MITIGVPKILKDWKKARLTCEININNDVKELWLEVERKYAKYLVKDRCDAFLIAILTMAMRKKEDITCLSPVSEELLHNLTMQLIPALSKYGQNFYRTNINVKNTKKQIKNKGYVGTGFSRGIDSMHVLRNYLNSPFKNLNITHLCINDVGAFDIPGYSMHNRDAEKTKQQSFERSIKAANELGLKYILTKTNIRKDFSKNYVLDHI